MGTRDERLERRKPQEKKIGKGQWWQSTLTLQHLHADGSEAVFRWSLIFPVLHMGT